MLRVCLSWFVVVCLMFVFDVLFGLFDGRCCVVCWLMCVSCLFIRRVLFVVCLFVLFVVRCLSFVLRCLSFVVCCGLFSCVVCCVLLVIG